ncbi:helix-turn-helix domain-containing protein [Corynebacterium casei]|uniref:helix-turn-helix domain-containing protein n=1 Tax=Corynebacterium casei TaxID=160386 RepID=UPI003FD1F8D3
MATREPWVTLDVAAEHFSVSRRTLTRWIEKRRIPARKLGRSVRVQLSALEDAMTKKGRR